MSFHLCLWICVCLYSNLIGFVHVESDHSCILTTNYPSHCFRSPATQGLNPHAAILLLFAGYCLVSIHFITIWFIICFLLHSVTIAVTVAIVIVIIVIVGSMCPDLPSVVVYSCCSCIVEIYMAYLDFPLLYIYICICICCISICAILFRIRILILLIFTFTLVNVRVDRIVYIYIFS